MYVVGKNHRQIINMDHVASVRVGDTSIKIDYANGAGCELMRYSTSQQAATALEMLYESIGKRDVFVLPDEDQIKARVINTKRDDISKHKRDGSKQKGHGGS